MIHENLIFIVCSPRSGSTLLQRMLGSHSQVYSHPEPHLLTHLNYLGYYDTVDKAPFDHINAAQALREFCQELPNGEQDYLDACRAYASTIYERVLKPTGRPYFLDKTPEYATVLPLIGKLYPRARYVVLTRHPMAIWHSQAHSFFGGDYVAAHQTNPILPRYMAAIGAFLNDPPVDLVRVRYEDLVTSPEAEARRILDHLGLQFEQGVVEYGKHKHISKSYGDPVGVAKHSRPVTASVDKWANDLIANPDALKLAHQLIQAMDPEHLAAWGYPKENLFDALEGTEGAQTRLNGFDSYQLKRKALLLLRRNIHQNRLGAAVKKVRYYCDVLLRT